MKRFKSEHVQDKETTIMNVNQSNQFLCKLKFFKWSFLEFIANDLQISTLDQKWAGDSMTICTACCIQKYLLIW